MQVFYVSLRTDITTKKAKVVPFSKSIDIRVFGVPRDNLELDSPETLITSVLK